MKRIMLLLTVALVMALMMVASALPAFATHAPANDEHANCLGAAGSDTSTQIEDDPTLTGASRSDDARDGQGRVDAAARGELPIDPAECAFEFSDEPFPYGPV
jgi:hypothetical protein